MLTERDFQSLPPEIYGPALKGMTELNHDLMQLAAITCIILCGIDVARALIEYMECHAYSGKY